MYMPGFKRSHSMPLFLSLYVILVMAFSSASGQDKMTLHMIGNVHIDLAYRWRWNETADRVLKDAFTGVLDVMEKEPDLTFAQSQLIFYEQALKWPDILARIRQKITERKWSVVGGQWCEIDETLPGGRSDHPAVSREPGRSPVFCTGFTFRKEP